MNKTTFIQLDKHIERIMPLECVVGINKQADGSYIFHLDYSDLQNWANEGDWLVECNDNWYCITNEQKENGYEPWKG